MTPTATIEKIKRCPLPQTEICYLNPIIGSRTEVTVKQSIERSIIRQHLRGTVRLTEKRDKRTLPDILVDIIGGPRLSFDIKHWTDTRARGGRTYLSRESYGSQRRGPDSLTTYLSDSSRFLFVCYECAITDSQGHRERRLSCVPGRWLKNEYDRSTERGLWTAQIIEPWPSYGKGPDLRYDIDIIELIGIADSFEGGRRS